MKDKAYYIHGLFDLAVAANLRQIKVICAFASTFIHEQIGATETEGRDVPQAFDKYVDLDDVTTRIEMHSSRALLVHSVLRDETDDIALETYENWEARHDLARSKEFSEVIADYLYMLSDEAAELRALVDEFHECMKTERQRVEN